MAPVANNFTLRSDFDGSDGFVWIILVLSDLATEAFKVCKIFGRLLQEFVGAETSKVSVALVLAVKGGDAIVLELLLQVCHEFGKRGLAIRQGKSQVDSIETRFLRPNQRIVDGKLVQIISEQYKLHGITELVRTR